MGPNLPQFWKADFGRRSALPPAFSESEQISSEARTDWNGAWLDDGPACKTSKLESSTSPCEKTYWSRAVGSASFLYLLLKVKIQIWIQLNAALTDQRRAEISLIGPIQAWKDSTIGISNNFSANFNFATRQSFIQELNEMSSACTPLSCWTSCNYYH